MARLIDADALMNYCNNQKDKTIDVNDIARFPTAVGWISVKEVANIIADLFGDGCACNSNDIDEWLPQYCEYRDTDCPHPPGVACWEQYLKHLDKKPNGGG